MASNRRRLLIVEDHEAIRISLKKSLELEGYLVDMADNGRTALDVLKQKPLPDLIILDLIMPEMDGYEFLDHIRKDARQPEASLPVIVVSAVANRDKSILTQVQAMIEKPFDFENLNAEIHRLLNNKQT